MNELLSGYWIGACVMSADSDMYREKQPPIPFTRMKFTSFQCRVDCQFFLLSHLILSQHISVEWKTIELRLLFCRCHYDTVRSSRKLDYSPTECIMISSQFKSSSVDCLWFGREWAVVIDHRRVKQHRDEHIGCHLELKHWCCMSLCHNM